MKATDQDWIYVHTNRYTNYSCAMHTRLGALLFSETNNLHRWVSGCFIFRQ